MIYEQIVKNAGLEGSQLSQGTLGVRTPIDGSEIGRIRTHSATEVRDAIARAAAAFSIWREAPAPKRGELVRLFGEELRREKDNLGRLVSLESGKILQEGLGEVQEMIDICDLAVGQSRQLYGLTIASERPQHSMREVWHPLGVCGVITAFNFPVAPWAWNAALALACGNPVVWKPSEKTPLSALATLRLFDKALSRFGSAPDALLQVVIGGSEAGQALVENPSVAIVSATGSTRMGRAVAPKVASRFAKGIFELGGNNAMIVAPTADLDLAVRAIVFSAVGTCGQRCTSLRRLIVQDDVYGSLVPRLKSAYGTLPIGDPLKEGVLVGPLIDGQAFDKMEEALGIARDDGGEIFGGKRILTNEFPNGHYVNPAIAEMPEQTDIVRRETFAPILYVMRYGELSQAIEMQNDVPQGLSSCIFSNDIREAETFLSNAGSDCGIANVNIGPSGAEIGGAFGGEKETGGGRESGSDAWKAYMRRQTQTVNYSRALPLAQGIRFEI
ncbi:MAG TPA: aldehyde dehydrogenase family protein [Aestuariivirgaceae bacterium]